ncbi:MAG: Calx-beta domain-containing protein, partial [Nitrosopumilaceae archaeon]
SRGYAVVTLHAQDHAQTFPNGTYINAPNATLMADLEAIIDGVNLKNYPIRTFDQVLSFNATVSIDDVTQVEDDSGASNFEFTVTRSNNSGSLSVDYVTEDVTANSPSDFTSISTNTLNFSDGGSLTQTINVSVKGDTTVEPGETFNVNLSNCTGCNISDNQGIGTITNDDFPTISITNVTKFEGDSGSSNFIFNVTRSSTTGAISVKYQTMDVTATVSDSDYISHPLTTINFGDGGLSTKQITVIVNGDPTVELDETFNVDLSACVGCTITNTPGIGIITNDDIPTVSITDVTLAEGNSGSSNFVFNVTRSSNVGSPSVQYQTTDASATSPNDFNSIPLATLNFVNGGVLTKTITVPVNGDTIVELDETFNVNLSNCTGCIITDNLGVGTILDDDAVGSQNDLDSDGILDTSDTENIINSSKIITVSHIVIGNVIVQNGSLLTIPNSHTLILISGSDMIIESGSGVLINSGGTIRVIP